MNLKHQYNFMDKAVYHKKMAALKKLVVGTDLVVAKQWLVREVEQ